MTDAAAALELHGRGQLVEAEQRYRAALEAQPEDITLRRDFAVLLMQSRREAEAVALIDQPDWLDRADADLLSILALCLRAGGRHARALEIAERINRVDVSSGLGWLLSGSLQVALGDARSAEVSLRRCLAIEPGLAEAWHHLGEALQLQCRWGDAIEAYRVAARVQPAEVFNIAICNELAGRIEQAAEGYAAMLRLKPGRADVLARLAQVQAMQCQHEAEGATTTRLADVLAKPLAADDAPEPFSLAFLDLDIRAKAAALRHYSARFPLAATPLPEAGRPGREPTARRIGYISADFGSHAVGHLVRAHFAAHDRNRFHVTGYSLRQHGGALAEEIRLGFDAFMACEALSDRSVAEAIRADGIDVLVDMSGFTQGARPRILAMRPAPLQLGWLGFVHGHQAPWLDALLMDEHVLPADMDWPYDDRVVRLPGTLLPGSPMPAGRRDRARFGLPEDVPVLASFNGSYKLSPDLTRAWVAILQFALRAHLMVYLPLTARAGFMRQWSDLDGPGDRLHIVDKLPIEEQSDRAASCDLLLDAFRYQGGATSMQAVASSLPVLTLAGRTSPLARLSVSINRFLEMDELVCGDVSEYIVRATALANDPEELRRVRERLQQQVALHRLFEPRRAASGIEQAILAMLGRPE